MNATQNDREGGGGASAFGFTIRRTPRERSGQARHQRPVTRVNVWSVLAEWTTAIVALALLAFYYFALGSATNADRSESSYMLLFVYVLMSSYMRVCYILTTISKTYVLATQGPREVSVLPGQGIIDGTGVMMFIVEPGHFIALCWITHHAFPLKACADMRLESWAMCTSLHIISSIFVAMWVCTGLAVVILVMSVFVWDRRSRRGDGGGIATALRLAPIPDHFREQLVNNLPVTPEAPEDGLCAICFESETQLEWRLLPCGHRFHPGCVDEWLKKEGGTCPTCRHDPTKGGTVRGGIGAAAGGDAMERGEIGAGVSAAGASEAAVSGAGVVEGEEGAGDWVERVVPVIEEAGTEQGAAPPLPQEASSSLPSNPPADVTPAAGS